MRLLYIALLLSALSFGQDRNGISYQALILNPQGEQLPGANNNTVPMANTEVCLRFHITTNAGSYNEYSERQVLTTDAYGMINTVVGTGAPVGTIMWNQIVWTEDSKGLKVEIDYSGECSSFVALSSQELTSVPFALYSPASNIPGPPGEAGDSAYQVWIDEGNTGTEQEFLDSLKGTDGEPGDPGADGDSAYQLWIDEGNTGTEQEFLDSLKGTDGDPGEGTEGKSAYQLWLDAGNTGSEQEFLDSLKGSEGKSAYEIWIELGNTGTEQDFIDSLVGPQGEPGQDGTGTSGNGLANAVTFTETKINLFTSTNYYRNINYWATQSRYYSEFYTTTTNYEVNIYDNNLNKKGQSINIDNLIFPTGYNKFDIKTLSSLHAINSTGDGLVMNLITNDDKKHFAFIKLVNRNWEIESIIEFNETNSTQYTFNQDLTKLVLILNSSSEISVRSYNVDKLAGLINLNDQYNLPITNSYRFFKSDDFSKIIITGFNGSQLNLQVLNVTPSFIFNKLFDFEIPHSFVPYSQDKVSINSLSMNSDGSLLAVIIGVRTQNYPYTIREYEGIIYTVQETALVKKMSWDMPNYSGSGGNTGENILMSAPQMILNESGDKVFFSDSSSTYYTGGLWNVYDISLNEFIPLGGDNYNDIIQYHNLGGSLQRMDNWRDNLIFGESRGNVLIIKKVL